MKQGTVTYIGKVGDCFAPEEDSSVCKYLEQYMWSFSCFFSAMLRGMWGLRSPTRDRTHAPCLGSAESKNTGLPGKSC